MIHALSWLAVFRRRIEVKLAWWFRRETPRSGPLGLKRQLIAEGKTRWLDIGNGDKFDAGFHYLDWFPHEPSDAETDGRCFRGDILRMTEEELSHLGWFDLVRMQHVFEHFCYGEGPEVLSKCGRLLNPGGRLVRTVRDPQFFTHAWFCNGFGAVKNFSALAEKRVSKGAPPSDYYAVFARSFGYGHEGSRGEHQVRDQHKWCYDAEGLPRQFRRTGGFRDVHIIGLLKPIASIPFTHNKPEQDVCGVAQGILETVRR